MLLGWHICRGNGRVLLLRKIPVVDERGGVCAGEGLGNLAEQGLALDVAVGAQARGDAVQLAIVVAGMATELVGPSGRKRVQNLGEGCGVELAGGRDCNGAVGGEDVGVAQLGVRFEARAQATDEADGETAHAAAVVERERPVRLEGVADGADSTAIGDLQKRASDGRKEMRVLVRVDVGNADPRALKLLNLREGFARNLFFADLSEQKSPHKIDQRWAEVFAVGTEERGDGAGRRDGRAVGEHDVAANAERGVGAGDGNGVVEGGAGGHQRSGGQHSS